MKSPSADAFRQLYTALPMIDGRKRHAWPSHVRFLPLDFTRPLPLRDASFELQLALHAGGIARACGRYLRPAGSWSATITATTQARQRRPRATPRTGSWP
jgi:hypothetical protein